MLRRLLIVVLLGSLLGLAYDRVHHRVLPRMEERADPAPRGAFHVHSRMSHDSSLPIDGIATAAARLGLDFVVLTDHDHQLAGPMVREGVVLLSAAELKTPFGHLIQLGAIDVLHPERREEVGLHASVRALGGIPIIAHPSDRRRPWEGAIDGAGGLEIANLSSAARRRGGPVFAGLLGAMSVWRLRPDLALAQVYDRDDAALRRWDGESDPRFVGLCGGDVHGRINLDANLQAWVVALEGELPADGDRRAHAILEQLIDGRFHCVAGTFGAAPHFSFAARLHGDDTVKAGASVPLGHVVALKVEGPDVRGAEPILALLRNGEELVRTRGDRLTYSHPGPGTYRVEVRLPIPGVWVGERLVPVIYSGRIRVEAEPTWSQVPAASAVPRPR